MSIEILKEIIEEHWGVSYPTLDEDTPLIVLAEQIAMDSENCSREEAYKMYIDNPALHLPGLISFYLIDEMGLTSKNVNAGMTLSMIFTYQNSEK